MSTFKEVEEGKVWAFLGIFLTVIGFLLVLLLKKKNAYALYYAKQGLVLFIAGIVAAVVDRIVGFIPVVGWLVSTALWVIVLILWVMGIVYALSGEEKEIPLVGELAKKIKV